MLTATPWREAAGLRMKLIPIPICHAICICLSDIIHIAPLAVKQIPPPFADAREFNR